MDDDPLVAHFEKLLVTKTGKDGNVQPAIAMGDCTMLLQILLMKLQDFEKQIDRSNPGRFRGTANLQARMESVLGDGVRLHITKWGASHFRGAIRDDDKRGNKRHILEMIDLINSYERDISSLEGAIDRCVQLHHEFFDQFRIKVEVQQTDEVQTQLAKILAVSSLGRVQQGLVYAVLRRRFGHRKRVETKRTWAGDEQSSIHGEVYRGDVQVYEGMNLTLAIEVKAGLIDRTGWKRVEDTHGQHDYDLFLLTGGYRPLTLQFEISSLSKTFALHLTDFLFTCMFFISSDESIPMPQVLDSILKIYNREFCEEIEKDDSIRIELVVP